MDAVNQRRSQMIARIRPFLSRIWYFLRSPKTTGVLIFGLVTVLALGLLLPQQPVAVATGVTARAVWINALPAWLQPAGPMLFSLGFAGIFYSVWFWVPAALLWLNSLVALADYVPGCWQRIGHQTPPVRWQHPLAQRVEYSVRLSHFPDNFTEFFQVQLKGQGFAAYARVEEKRIIAASRRKWAWLGWIIFYLGLLTLVIAFVFTFYSLQTQHLTLSPLQARQVNLWPGQLALTAVDPTHGVGQLMFTPADGGPAQLLTWHYYRPAFFNNTLVVPAPGKTIVTVEVRDSTGGLILLDPLPENLVPTEHLRMPIDDSVDTSVYFTIPAMDIAVQVSPETPAGIFNVQIRRGDGAVLIDNMQVQSGQPFQIRGMTAVLLLEHSINVVVWRNIGLPFYVLAVALILGGGILVLLRPAVIWLIPDVKGIGGQLYGVMETFGPERKMSEFLTHLLAADDSTTHENEA